MKLRKGDTVEILIGKDKGKTGKIEKVNPATNRVLIPGVNEFKRHLKSRATDQKSEIVTITKGLPVSNVSIICPKCKKKARIGFKIEKGKKLRVCSNCHKFID